MKLTPEQQEAVDYDAGNLLIVACAGSGKTETIARRVARLVHDGFSKNSIVAFTFTEHAADELKARIRRHLQAIVPEEPSLGDMYIGTIHSFCLRVLKEQDAGYRRWEVMDEVRQAALISANFIRFEEDGRGIGLDRLRSLTRTGTYWETVRRFKTTLNVVYQKGIPPEDLPDHKVSEAISRYERLAYQAPNYFFDFNKIIQELLDFLRTHPASLADLRTRLCHIVVDEYQDVDDRQEELIRLLSQDGHGIPVTAVGDDDQALYGFRGASVHNILTFEERYPSVKRIVLGANFRCTEAIVEVADTAIQRVARRLPKEMVARTWDAETHEIVERLAEPGDLRVRTFPSEEAEAEWVADRIKALRGTVYVDRNGTQRGLDYADMAILLRSVKNAGSLFAQTLRRQGIPVVISGTNGLFNNDEVRLVQAAFCLLARADFGVPDDDGKLRILSTVDTREYVREVLARLQQTQKVPSASPGRFLAWIDEKLEELDRRSLSRELRGKRLAARIYPQEIFQEMLSRLGSQEIEWPSDVLFNLGSFSKLITQFEAVHQWITPSRLKGLCLFLGNWAVNNAEEGGLEAVTRLNSVQIMTVHAAKGLEWPIVFLPRVSSSNFPSSRRNHGPETFIPESVFDPSEYAGGDDGERRLWYVALTRCAKFLHISSPDRPRKKPTDFFRDIRHHVMRRDDIEVVTRQRAEPQPPDDAVLFPTTFSDLTYWKRCPFEYQLRSLMGFGPGVDEQFGYGQQLHNILAEIHTRAREGVLLDALAVRDLVDQRFHLRYTQGPPFDALKEAAKLALVRYVQSSGEALRKTQAVEKPFEFIDTESGALITGVVDLLEKVSAPDATAGREAVGIVDFKAHRITSLEEFERLKELAESQLRLYASAVRYAFPYEPATATAQLIVPKAPSKELLDQGVAERIAVDVSESKRAHALSEVRSAVQGIRASLESGCFDRTGPAKNVCKRCDFRTFCPGFNEWRRLDKTSPTPPNPTNEREAEVDELLGEMNAGQTTQ